MNNICKNNKQFGTHITNQQTYVAKIEKTTQHFKFNKDYNEKKKKHAFEIEKNVKLQVSYAAPPSYVV